MTATSAGQFHARPLPRPLRCAAVAAVVALGGCLAANAPPFARIRLEARTPAGDPVRGARTEALGGGAYQAGPRAVGYTGSDGKLRLTVPGGDYEVRVLAPGDEWRPAAVTHKIRLGDSGDTTLVAVFTRDVPGP